MNRITSKSKGRYTGKTSTGWKKLQQLEDIEEELGVDLITLFKALKEGVWFGDVEPTFCKYPKLRYFDIRNEYHLIDYDGTYAKVGDYLCEWAIKKEEVFKNE